MLASTAGCKSQPLMNKKFLLAVPMLHLLLTAERLEKCSFAPFTAPLLLLYGTDCDGS
jgi:hypothetical protein